MSRAPRRDPPTVSSVSSQVDPTPRASTGRAADVVDVFVYVVVLNLFIQYVPAVISETFTLSLLTAVLLKGVLEVVLAVKKRARGRFTAARGAVGKVGAGLLLWGVLVGSKFVVLELTDLVFGDSVSLGGFVSVTLLILTLLVSRLVVRRMLAPVPQVRGPAG